MFNQQKYINSYIKDNYKSIKLRVRKDNRVLIHKLMNVDNINQYINDLIMNDILEHRTYHYINNEVEIDFELSKTMSQLVEEAEMADLIEDYGLYMNIADAIDSRAKKEVTHQMLKESQWKKLSRRYCL